MVKALIALPSDVPIEVLSPVLSASGVIPRLVLDGVGAIADLPPDMLQTVANLPGLASAIIATGATADLSQLPVLPQAIPWLQALRLRSSTASRSCTATRRARRSSCSWRSSSVLG